MKAVQSILIATRSSHKLAEIQEILGARPRLLTLDEAGIPPADEEDAIEAFDTFRTNAVAKAQYFLQRSGLPVIADDSGIMIDALEGRPGVRSKRFSGVADLTGNALDLANNAHAVQLLREHTDSHDESTANDATRTAHYICAAALAQPNGETFVAIGSCSGVFLLEPRGSGGFGYDPHFLLPLIGRTFGELNSIEKHQFSHRARAFRALAPLLV
ncbi:MAG: non-canonical purine NTP pyrophosphatase [Longimicrobiales bacterium]